MNELIGRESPMIESFQDSTQDFTAITKIRNKDDVHTNLALKKKKAAPHLISIKSVFQVCCNLV